jgi:hypothetical protein
MIIEKNSSSLQLSRVARSSKLILCVLSVRNGIKLDSLSELKNVWNASTSELAIDVRIDHLKIENLFKATQVVLFEVEC